MRRFQWNSLGVGDHVQLHQSAGPELTDGVIQVVEVVRGSNGVGVRVDQDVLWPARMTVHLEPRDPAESCWRCDAALGI
ncbi:MAG: hypothetical protein QOE35_2788 [Actinomycetota bacterium]|jgi:hypothetical protein